MLPGPITQEEAARPQLSSLDVHKQSHKVSTARSRAPPGGQRPLLQAFSQQHREQAQPKDRNPHNKMADRGPVT